MVVSDRAGVPEATCAAGVSQTPITRLNNLLGTYT